MPFVFLFLLLSLSFNAMAQQCDPSQSPSTPTDDFFINDDGTVTHLETGQTWMRCVVGQHWDGKNCVGEAKKFTWREAFALEDKYNREAFAGHKNWHIPRLPELAAIVERQCIKPRINAVLFPNTPAASFWTANHKKSDEAQAFALDFDEQGLQVLPQQIRVYVRLVSGRE